eukprot:SAG22_NODE_6622_length_830_cov_1.700410_1_plen_125_part_00
MTASVCVCAHAIWLDMHVFVRSLPLSPFTAGLLTARRDALERHGLGYAAAAAPCEQLHAKVERLYRPQISGGCLAQQAANGPSFLLFLLLHLIMICHPPSCIGFTTLTATCPLGDLPSRLLPSR